MTEGLERLLEAAKKVNMTRMEKEEQRESFAYGNAHIENELITRETVKKQAKILQDSYNGEK